MLMMCITMIYYDINGNTVTANVLVNNCLLLPAAYNALLTRMVDGSRAG